MMKTPQFHQIILKNVRQTIVQIQNVLMKISMITFANKNYRNLITYNTMQSCTI